MCCFLDTHLDLLILLSVLEVILTLFNNPKKFEAYVAGVKLLGFGVLGIVHFQATGVQGMPTGCASIEWKQQVMLH